MLIPDAQERIENYLASFWSKSTAYNPENWTKENPAHGQCVPTSLAIQKYLGGDILKCRLSCRDGSPSETHYWNVIGEHEIDATFIQYQNRKLGDEVFVGIVSKQTLLEDMDTRKRYELFMDSLNAGSDPLGFFFSLKST